ncbi:hypothetical protein CC2G_011264 [Coprinopsis cinerea AmutBmut pab1-1]|nr:hypothetical protein CC2G_011264 [Coprinopsis cinerea AmutBmut pab1-1]
MGNRSGYGNRSGFDHGDTSTNQFDRSGYNHTRSVYGYPFNQSATGDFSFHPANESTGRHLMGGSFGGSASFGGRSFGGQGGHPVWSTPNRSGGQRQSMYASSGSPGHYRPGESPGRFFNPANESTGRHGFNPNDSPSRHFNPANESTNRHQWGTSQGYAPSRPSPLKTTFSAPSLGGGNGEPSATGNGYLTGSPGLAAPSVDQNRSRSTGGIFGSEGLNFNFNPLVPPPPPTSAPAGYASEDKDTSTAAFFGPVFSAQPSVTQTPATQPNRKRERPSDSPPFQSLDQLGQVTLSPSPFTLKSPLFTPRSPNFNPLGRLPALTPSPFALSPMVTGSANTIPGASDGSGRLGGRGLAAGGASSSLGTGGASRLVGSGSTSVQPANLRRTASLPGQGRTRERDNLTTPAMGLGIGHRGKSPVFDSGNGSTGGAGVSGSVGREGDSKSKW